MLSSDKLLAGVEEYDGAVESAVRVRGEDGTDEEAEWGGETTVLKLLLLFDLDGVFEYDDCVTNLGWEWDRRRGLEEK